MVNEKTLYWYCGRKKKTLYNIDLLFSYKIQDYPIFPNQKESIYGYQQGKKIAYLCLAKIQFYDGSIWLFVISDIH